jgi:hypothetical protein
MIAQRRGDPMRHLLRALVVFASCLVPSAADACSCTSPGPPCQALFQSDVVFVGTVRSITPTPSPQDVEPQHVTLERRVVRFAIERAVRGLEGRVLEVDVRTGSGGGDCGFAFTAGQRYIVYAYRHAQGWLGTGICTRTRLASEAADDLAYFGALPPTGAGARMFGTVNHWEHDPAKRTNVQHGPVADVQVLLRGPRGTYSAMTDTAGNYTVAGIPVGSYEVEVLPPPVFSTRHLQRKIEFSDPRACRAENFSLHYDGRIIGTLLDSSGRPAAGVRLDVVAADHPREPPSFYIEKAVTDGAGRFELADVAPGRYLLAVGLTLAMDAEVSYPTTFYPGTPMLERARPIEIGAGTHVELDPLRLPDALARHTLSGTIVRPDGTPMSGVGVSLSGPRAAQAAAGIATDAQGRFSFRVFEGVTYTVHAYYNAPDAPQRQLRTFEVVRIAGPPAPLRLVLSPR